MNILTLRLIYLVFTVAIVSASGASLGSALAAEVRIVETWPTGGEVVLPRNQNFYLRLAYDTATPVGIWVAPYFQGKRVNVGSSPSPRYSGSGEAMVWFFFMQPGEEVDEIRITAGDGRAQSTPVVATWRGYLTAGSAADATASPPEWVTRMNAQAKAAQEQAYRERMAEPVSAGDVALLNGFMLGMLALGLAGFAAPAWGLWRWRGGWRLAAAVPAAMMAFVVLRLIVDVARDPTSHNLWPFEILMTGALSVAVMTALGWGRRHFGQER